MKLANTRLVITFTIYKGGRNKMKSYSFFSFAGCNGTEMDLFMKKTEQGFKELYYSAPYHWALVHIELKKIITYTESDVTEYACKDRDELIIEMKRHIGYLKEYGYSKSVFREGESLLKKYGVGMHGY
jgi:hypothetical protein